MLPGEARLRRPEEFRAVVRGGVRIGRPTLVVHALRTMSPPSRAGFVVSKQVGNAVTRNRVKRRLRHLAAAALASSPVCLDVVVRALPDAATGDLADDFASAWARAVERVAA